MQEKERQPPRLIRIREVLEMTGLSRSYIYALTSSGKFPRSVPLIPGGIARGWVLSEIEEWVEQRIAERESPA